MATRNFTVFMPVDNVGNNIPNAIGVKWIGLLNGDDGEPYVVGHRLVKSVQLYGTLGAGGNCNIEGTLDPVFDTTGTKLAGGSAPTYAVLNDPQGNALGMNAAKIEQVQEHVTAIRPKISAGDGTTSLTCVALFTSPNL